MSRSHFHLSSVDPCKKKTLKKAKKFFRVSLLSVSKDSLVNFFLGKPLEFLPVHSRLHL